MPCAPADPGAALAALDCLLGGFACIPEHPLCCPLCTPWYLVEMLCALSQGLPVLSPC